MHTENPNTIQVKVLNAVSLGITWMTHLYSLQQNAHLHFPLGLENTSKVKHKEYLFFPISFATSPISSIICKTWRLKSCKLGISKSTRLRKWAYRKFICGFIVLQKSSWKHVWKSPQSRVNASHGLAWPKSYYLQGHVSVFFLMPKPYWLGSCLFQHCP